MPSSRPVWRAGSSPRSSVWSRDLTDYASFFSRDAHNFRPSPIRAFAKLINDPRIISFAGGVPSPETFPAIEMAEIAARVIRDRREVALQYGPTRGLPRLCEAIA